MVPMSALMWIRWMVPNQPISCALRNAKIQHQKGSTCMPGHMYIASTGEWLYIFIFSYNISDEFEYRKIIVYIALALA